MGTFHTPQKTQFLYDATNGCMCVLTKSSRLFFSGATWIFTGESSLSFIHDTLLLLHQFCSSFLHSQTRGVHSWEVSARMKNAQLVTRRESAGSGVLLIASFVPPAFFGFLLYLSLRSTLSRLQKNIVALFTLQVLIPRLANQPYSLHTSFQIDSILY